MVEDNTILGSDAFNIRVEGLRSRIIGNLCKAAGTIGISSDATGDDSVIVGNIVQDPGTNPIEIGANSENIVVVANRTDGAVVDNSGTGTVASNDEATF